MYNNGLCKFQKGKVTKRENNLKCILASGTNVKEVRELCKD